MALNHGSDVADALFKLPPVQGLVERTHDEGLRQLRLLRGEWNRASPGERTVMVTMTGLVVGSSVGIILANEPTRHAAFDLIKGRDIPVPLVDGATRITLTCHRPTPESRKGEV